MTGVAQAMLCVLLGAVIVLGALAASSLSTRCWRPPKPEPKPREPAPNPHRVPAPPGYMQVEAEGICPACGVPQFLYLPIFVPNWGLLGLPQKRVPLGLYCAQSCEDVHTTQLNLERLSKTP